MSDVSNLKNPDPHNFLGVILLYLFSIVPVSLYNYFFQEGHIRATLSQLVLSSGMSLYGYLASFQQLLQLSFISDSDIA